MQPAWLLIVKPDERDPTKVIVYDPQQAYAVAYQGKSYEETHLWLNEDEYQLVEGRTFLHSIWPLPTRDSS